MKKIIENSNDQTESIALDYLDLIGGEIQDINAAGGWQKDRRSVDFFKELGIDPQTASKIFQKALNMNKGGSPRESVAEQKIRRIIREEIAKMKMGKSSLKESPGRTPTTKKGDIFSVVNYRSGDLLKVRATSDSYVDDENGWSIDYQYDTKGPLTAPKFDLHNKTHWTAIYDDGTWEMSEG